MIIGVPKERLSGERRVAITPDVVKRFARDKVSVWIERGAGTAAGYTDDAFAAAGAQLVDADAVWSGVDVVAKVQRPEGPELDRLGPGAVLIGILGPLVNHGLVRALVDKKVTSFSLDLLPRITRAQSMDALSSMSTVAGYKAVLVAAANHGKFFPMLVTAAGTVAPARVMILGAGVAGLQAIATARRLGAVVVAFDVRPEVQEQVESLGAKFLVAEQVDASGEGGYAKELSDEQHQRELELIHKAIKEVDVVITTALIPGRPAPKLITEPMVKDMRPGSVIVDLASEAGGNCALTEKGETITVHGVTIIGPENLAASMPFHASQMYARNIQSFVGQLVKDGALALDLRDEVVGGTCITHDGKIVHQRVRDAIDGGG